MQLNLEGRISEALYKFVFQLTIHIECLKESLMKLLLCLFSLFIPQMYKAGVSQRAQKGVSIRPISDFSVEIGEFLY